MVKWEYEKNKIRKYDFEFVSNSTFSCLLRFYSHIPQWTPEPEANPQATILKHFLKQYTVVKYKKN
jgi:hypothetical protein